MESAKLIAGNQDKLTKSVFINIIDTDFSMKDYVGEIGSEILYISYNKIKIKLDKNYPKPVPQEGEALIRVTLAGICNTDYEITKGKMDDVFLAVTGKTLVGGAEK